MEQDKLAKSTLIGGGLAALAASACCLGPLVLVSVGVGGAWISTLTKLEPFRPLFIGIALLCMALAYRKIFRAPAAAVRRATAIEFDSSGETVRHQEGSASERSGPLVIHVQRLPR